MLIPVTINKGFIITFEAIPEIHANKKLFTAKVSAWKDGQELSEVYMSGCNDKKPADFYTKFRDDYFTDMANRAVEKAITALDVQADPNGEKIKKLVGLNRDEICAAISKHYSEKLNGKVFCHFFDNSYEISGQNLPADPSLADVYPNGWTMNDTISEKKAISIAKKGKIPA